MNSNTKNIIIPSNEFWGIIVSLKYQKPLDIIPQICYNIKCINVFAQGGNSYGIYKGIQSR